MSTRLKPRAALIGACALSCLVGACGHAASSRPAEVPATQVPLPRAAPVTRLSTGLKVVVQPAVDGVASAALLIGGGPLDDPAELPGLGELMVHAALAGTLGDSTVDARPEQRALDLGASLDVVADGRVLGWLVRGPAEAAPDMLTLLHDVATRPTFPATHVDILIAMARETVEEGGSAAVDTAVGIAAGAALGLGRALPLEPTQGMLERVNREDVVRHWRGIVRPERAVLVLRLPGVSSLPGPLGETWGGWQGIGPGATSPAPCVPQGQQVHRVTSQDAARSRSIALMALAVPSSASEERVALEALALWLGDQPGGPIEAVVGVEDAHRSRPWLLDLGWNGGRGAAVMLSGVTGDNDKVSERVRGLAEVLARQAVEEVLDEAEAAGMLRAALGLRRILGSTPVTGLVELGARALYGQGQGSLTPSQIHQMARQHLAPHHLVVTIVGAAEVNGGGGERGVTLPETRWSERGERLTGPPPVRCVPQGPRTDAEMSVDTAGQRQ